MEYNMEELCKTAIDIQDACNLSGVVIEFSKVIIELRRLMKAEGSFSTQDLNNHPICVMFADKIKSMTGDDFAGAYDFCKRQINSQK
jgi:hypothetical protein